MSVGGLVAPRGETCVDHVARELGREQAAQPLAEELVELRAHLCQ